MKNVIYLLMLLVSASVTRAQIIQFDDPNFKSALVNANCVDIDGDNIGDIDADTNNDGELNLSEVLTIKGLVLDSLSISNLKGIEKFINLQKLNCKANQLTHLSLFNLPFLDEINCSDNQLIHFSIYNLPSLSNLTCSDNELTQLSLNDLPSLNVIYCAQNQLTNLTLYNLPSLNGLNCANNQLTQLSLSEFPGLLVVGCFNNPLTHLFVKFGFAKTLSIPGNFNSLIYICTDEININYFQNKFPNAIVNSYCNFTPGGKFYSISGKSKFDQNNNGCNFDDTSISSLKFNISSINSIGNYISNINGYIFIPVQEGTHTIKPIIENSDYYNVYPDSIVVTFPSTSDTVIQDFCITSKGIFRQVDLSIIPLTPPARPGFDASYKVVMTNKGSQIENGTLYFAYDKSRLDFVSTDVVPSTQTDGLLSWNFTDLLPFETRYYNVTLNVNSPSETPPVNAGDELLITCNILDNVFLLKQEVVGSYDPNDKTCLEGKTITPEQVGEYVHYLIRFENTGNYAAENVVVKDVIDESTFDITTLQITDASHEAWARITGNIVEFIFENIQLPFDDATNDGYVCFKIKTKPTLVLGNELKNEANIYFDYNLPILTNKTNTVVALPTSTDETNGKNDIEIFPNPVSDLLKFSTEEKIIKVEIFDMSGRLVQVSKVMNGEVHVERLLSGTYQLKVISENGKMNYKMVKI